MSAANPAGEAAPAPYLVTLGETMGLLTAQQPGPLAHVSSMGLGVGGSESNVAIGVQRLGGTAVWCGRTGTDSLGQLIRREIRAEGVTVRAVEDPGALTGLMLKERRTAATQKVSYYRAASAGSRLTPEDLDADLITGAAVLHVSGITPALSPSAAAAIHAAIDAARAAGVPVSFDLNYRANLWSAADATRSYQEIIPLVDIVFGGDEEAALAVGPAEDPVELAQRLTKLGPTQAIIKLGSKGAAAFIDGQVHHQPAVPIDAVDTVGAGDAFVAGYLAELMNGKSPEERLALAVQTGAFACLSYGDWEGLPTRAELALLHQTEAVTR
ncbi:sugar kinase [Arthrobacter sp. zg-Y859]|uniref:Sugar kinase n=1 Tax=Arthrobacter jinronghuae TaxID=2964609 RepID=A0ABT1NSR3_9MICC|nr:sugar kinase [Arthrobacter jinronghuae]MCQ1950781.1 sugar kinase [Arthrobacter jinronghuae]UWX79250.1 sugar kinase [Arthrobacter jinronghuae]